MRCACCSQRHGGSSCGWTKRTSGRPFTVPLAAQPWHPPDLQTQQPAPNSKLDVPSLNMPDEACIDSFWCDLPDPCCACAILERVFYFLIYWHAGQPWRRPNLRPAASSRSPMPTHPTTDSIVSTCKHQRVSHLLQHEPPTMSRRHGMPMWWHGSALMSHACHSPCIVCASHLCVFALPPLLHQYRARYREAAQQQITWRPRESCSRPQWR